MGRIGNLTNFTLFYLVFFVFLALGLGFFYYPFNSATDILTFLALLLGINVSLAVVARVFQVAFANKSSYWSQPVSTRASAILINGVIFVWLCVVYLLALLVLIGRGITAVALGMFFLTLTGGGLGWYLQTHFTRKSLLSYGIGFLFALVLIIVSMLVIYGSVKR